MSTTNILLATITTVLVVGSLILLRDRTCHELLMGNVYPTQYEANCGGNWYTDKYHYHMRRR